MCCHDDLFLLHAPSIAIDFGVELMVPPLPTLLANPPLEECGNQTPLPLPILLHQPTQRQVIREMTSQTANSTPDTHQNYFVRYSVTMKEQGDALTQLTHEPEAMVHT